ETPLQAPLPAVAEPIKATVIPISADRENPNNFNYGKTLATPDFRRSRPSPIRFCMTVSALAMATVSSAFSITGLTAIFVGAFWPVVAMGCGLQAAKLSAVAFIGRHGDAITWRLKAGLVILIAVLMALDSAGAFGFLSRAHIEHAVEGD